MSMNYRTTDFQRCIDNWNMRTVGGDYSKLIVNITIRFFYTVTRNLTLWPATYLGLLVSIVPLVYASELIVSDFISYICIGSVHDSSNVQPQHQLTPSSAFYSFHYLPLHYLIYFADNTTAVQSEWPCLNSD